MEKQERGVQSLYRTTLLTRSGIQAKSYLPPSRSILTSYAMEGRSSKEIRVSIFSNDLMTRVMPGKRGRG